MKFDVLIKNGSIIDGISKNPYNADIAIEGDKIAAIAPLIETGRAEKVIDAKGKLVTPGFIDVHSHSDYYLMIDNRAHSRLLQGVTTEIGGNCGYSAAPMFNDLYRDRAADYKKQFGIDVNWNNVSEYFNKLDTLCPAINFGLLIGYNTVRASVMGFDDRKPTDSEMKLIRQTIDQGLTEGAIGMSVGVVYPPACFSTEDELANAFSVVAEHEKIFTTHIRSEGDYLIESLNEVVRVAKKSGARLQVSHLKTAGKHNWSKIDKAFDILEEAKSDGVNLRADRYPYIASNTGLSVVLPDNAFDGGKKSLLKKLTDNHHREIFRKDILKRHPEPEYWENVMISQVVTEKNRDLEGVSVAKGATLRGKDPFVFYFDLLLEEDANVEAIYFVMSQENLDKIYEKPWVMVGSDSGARNIDGPLAIGRPHPRTFGSYPKFWSDYVREGKIKPVDAIEKMAVAPSEFYQIKKRGKLMEGYFADVAIFDPDTFSDTATYQTPHSYPVGIWSVLVNGKVCVDEGKIVDVQNAANIIS